MNKAIQDLKNEHGGIITMLNIMEAVATKIEHGGDIEKEHLEKISVFLSDFADKCHHGKEETILFPQLIKDKDNLAMINQLLGEHKTGRDYIGGINRSLSLFRPGNPDAVHIAINIRSYINLLHSHIKKENELFLSAEKTISGKLEKKIRDRFEKLEREVIGAGKHEEYHGWITELKGIYLT